MSRQVILCGSPTLVAMPSDAVAAADSTADGQHLVSAGLTCQHWRIFIVGFFFVFFELSKWELTFILYSFYFILFFKLYIIVLVLPNIKMNPPQVYMCSPS